MPERTAHPMPPAVEAYLRALIRTTIGAENVRALAFTWRGDGTGTATWNGGRLPIRGIHATEVRSLELSGKLPAPRGAL